MKADLHIHTRASDGIGGFAAIIAQARRRGLGALAIADHNTMDGLAGLQTAAGGLLIIPGCEYSTTHGHILALFCDSFGRDLPRDARGLYHMPAVVDFVRERGGLLIAAHPLRYRRYLDVSGQIRADLLAAVDGMEIINSRDLRRDETTPTPLAQIAQQHGLFVTGGSDAHLPCEVGRGYTQLPPDTPATLDGIKQALLAGQAVAAGEACRLAHHALWHGLRRVRRVFARR